MNLHEPVLTRRSFAFGIAALGGGLLLDLETSPGEAQGAPATGLSNPELTVWAVIESDDTVVIRVARSEMGQGGFTSLPMLVAEELECDWSRVRAEYVLPSDNLARDRAWGPMVTAGSLSIRTSQAYLRKAGAQAREMLIAEAASRWNIGGRERFLAVGIGCSPSFKRS